MKLQHRVTVLTLSLSVTACLTHADEDTPRPNQAQLNQALNPSYASPAHVRQECLGRLVFDAAQNMEWGVEPYESSVNLLGFNSDLRDGREEIFFEDTRISLFTNAKPEVLAQLREMVKLRRENWIAETQHDKEITQDLIRKIQHNTQKGERAASEATLRDYQHDLKEQDKHIAELRRQTLPTWKISDKLGYWDGPLSAYVYHDHILYFFEGSSHKDESPAQNFTRVENTIKQFRFRQTYEIPKERGFCIPFGFIPDNGATPFNIKMSMRYTDQPGVLYTIGTALVGEKSYGVSERSSQPVALYAEARAAVGLADDPVNQEAAKHVIERVGPKQAYIGALPSSQGGVALNLAAPGKPPLYSYSLYTGYGGWEDSQVLPAISVDMRAFKREDDSSGSLKQDPPPFAESKQRLDALLKSIRLRPTDIPMPELGGKGDARVGG